MAAPWLGYIPIPGLHAVAVWLAPDDGLTRYHARQSALLVWFLYGWLLFVGLMTGLSDSASYLATMGLLAGIPLVAVLVGLIVGAVGAAMGRFLRVRPAWDILAALSR